MYSQQPVHIQITSGKGEIELNPVDALSPAAVEIRSVGLLAMGPVTLLLSEIYLFLSPFTIKLFPRVYF